MDDSAVRDLTNLLHRRGPDGSGIWVADDRRVALGHRRLAIIDVGPQGAQPMSDASGRWVITFNGEIYNYRELRENLERAGCRFATQSDTEVLIQVVALWGAPGLRRLRGMYAFALWDTQKRELWLARDPYGIKPLYVGQTSDTIWFSSQARPLAAATPLDRHRDSAGLVGFYLWGHVPEPFSWWSGIRMFPAGHVQRIAMGQTVAPPVSFWSIAQEYTAKPAQVHRQEELRQSLFESVKYHLVSDVPVGVFLSSGIDSAIVAALAAETGAALKTVTLSFDEYLGTEDDEAPLAEAFAKQLGCDHTTVRITQPEFEALLADFFASMDQPSIDGLNSYLVSHVAARQGLKVALSGLGGDELFGGYPSFSQAPQLKRIAGYFPRSKTIQKILTGLVRSSPFAISPKIAGLGIHGRDIAGAYFLRRALFLEHELDDLLDESRVIEGLQKLSTISSLQKTIAAMRGSVATEYAQISALESSWYMRNQLLRDTDWASMAHGLEVRVPLVDAMLLGRVAPAINSAAPPTKRDVVACSKLIPDSISRRRKTGFTTPVAKWIAESNSRKERGLRVWSRDVHRYFRSAMNQHAAGYVDAAAA